jgi:hypothetical protein
MENMRSFRVITALISLLLLANCAAGTKSVSLKETEGTIGEMPAPMWLGDDIKYSYTGYLFRMTQYMMFTLNREEKKMHESAVFFALNHAENGKIVSWYSKERLAAGKVRVIHSYPISGGYCRTYQAYIKINGKARHMTNNACKKISIRRWSFYK